MVMLKSKIKLNNVIKPINRQSLMDIFLDLLLFQHVALFKKHPVQYLYNVIIGVFIY